MLKWRIFTFDTFIFSFYFEDILKSGIFYLGTFYNFFCSKESFVKFGWLLVLTFLLFEWLFIESYFLLIFLSLTEVNNKCNTETNKNNSVNIIIFLLHKTIFVWFWGQDQYGVDPLFLQEIKLSHTSMIQQVIVNIMIIRTQFSTNITGDKAKPYVKDSNGWWIEANILKEHSRLW